MTKTLGMRDTHFKMILSVFLRSTVILAAFAIFLISSYLYGPQGRGVISFLTAFYQTIGILISFGLGRVVYQKVAKDSSLANVLFHTLIRYVYVVSFLVFLLILLFALSCKYFLNVSTNISPLYFLLFIFSFPYFIWLNLSNFLFGVAQKTDAHDKLIFATRVLQVSILAVLGYFKLSLEYFIFVFGLIGYFIFFLEYRLLTSTFKDHIKPTWPESLAAFRSLFKDFKWPYVDSIAQSATPLAVFILGLNISQAELGHYNFAIQILGTLSFPLAVFQLKLQEKLVLDIADGGATLVKRSFAVVLPISLALAICGLAVPTLIPYAHLTSFNESMPLLKALLLTLPLTGMSYVFQSVWVGKHKAKLSSSINLMTSTLNILTVILLSHTLGAMAGVWGMYLSLSIGLGLQSYFLAAQWRRLMERSWSR